MAPSVQPCSPVLNVHRAASIAFQAACAGACAQPCPNQLVPSQILAASLQTDGPASETWFSQLDLLPTTPNGEFWRAAVTNSSAAPANGGVVELIEPAPTANVLLLGLPFPLVTGQSLDLTAHDPPGSSMALQMLPAASGATAWLVNCPGMRVCAVGDEAVTGTLMVQESEPLHVHIDATFTFAANAAASVDVHGVVSFDIQPQGTRCSSYND